ncbi:hypothetical protein DOTSEDRAFT_75437 [Dothistroma septosporum NZE10]|uniref:Zn(2)-C6 fungal-type domain-containing protein n=1 Tax=Dothistroma septosporum (strain NZE10 / CBS 128990) TaxID=675120 RepID=M2YIE8_DOTSN|nr:hypothetical protein DOTSEDRAFT_75437 [Dothistroma septosporum NZE10]
MAAARSSACPGSLSLPTDCRVCDNCRIKKIRCDMLLPSCQNCKRRKTSCRYGTLKRKPGPAKGQSARTHRQAQPQVSATEDQLHNFDEPLTAGADVANSLPRMEFDLAAFLEGSSNLGYMMSTEQELGLSLLPDVHQNPEVFSAGDDGSFLNDTTLTRCLTADTCATGMSEDDVLICLYHDHIQPMYPILPPIEARTHSIFQLPTALINAVCCVAARFADWTSISASDYAHAARAARKELMSPANRVRIDFLLCLYDLDQGLDLEVLVAVSRLVTLIELHGRQCGKHPSQTNTHERQIASTGTSASVETGFEDLEGLRWCILSLETMCNSLTTIPRTSPVIYASALSAASSDITSSTTRLLPLSEAPYWDQMCNFLAQSPMRPRNLHITTCALMAAVTEVRFRTSRPEDSARTRQALMELQSDYYASDVSLPSWWINPNRCDEISETLKDHQLRLNTLFVRDCAGMLLAICSADLDVFNGDGDQGHHAAYHWHSIMAAARRLIKIVEQCSRIYATAIDPFCCYIVMLTAKVITHDIATLADSTTGSNRSSATLDLLQNFMDNMAKYWDLASRIAASLRDLRKAALVYISHEAAIKDLATVSRQITGTIIPAA